jgi:hypothetical protein
MKRILIIVLVSDQAAPNVLFIKNRGIADHYYFISTAAMEKEGRTASLHIIKACNIPEGKFDIIEVEQDSMSSILLKLNNDIKINTGDRSIVNITGGTKIMSLAAHIFFSQKTGSEIFYLPIGKNTITRLNDSSLHDFTLIAYRLNLTEYLSSYGVQIKNRNWPKQEPLIKSPEVSLNILNTFLNNEHRSKFVQIAEKIRINDLRGKSITPDTMINDQPVYEECKTLSSLGMDFESTEFISKKETKYITGDWFEEFIYVKLKSTLNIPDEHIACGLNLVKVGNPNEYDVVFTLDNALYVIECKTDLSDSSACEEGKLSALFTSTLYKAATLKKEFGLLVNYYLFTLNDFSTLNDIHKKRASQFDIKLLGMDTIRDENAFVEYIRGMTKANA